MSKQRKIISPDDIDADGCIEVGLGKVLVCGPELVPHVWNRHRDNVEAAEEMSPEEFIEHEFKSYESFLLPIVESAAEEVPEGGVAGNLSMPLFLDFGSGRKQYRYGFFASIGPLLPGDPIESIDVDELAASKRSQDAWSALLAIANLRDDPRSTFSAIYLGRVLERLKLDEYRPLVLAGLTANKARRAGGQATAKLTSAERKIVVEARDGLMKECEQTKIWAAGKIAAQLSTGQLPGVAKIEGCTAKYIANLRAER